MGIVYTFYSYKGGVGRTMALVNTGTLLASWGYKVLMIDWDLEAPGLENYFKQHIDIAQVQQKEGLINLFIKRMNDEHFEVNESIWKSVITPITLRDQDMNISGNLHLLSAGRKDDDYFKHVRALDYSVFYENHNGGEFLEKLRERWKSEYDYILIDSRTGLTDSSGVCSIQMPDVLVLLFTATEQGFKGTLEVARRALKGRLKLIYDRYELKLLPIPTRFDQTEFKLQQEWLGKFSSDLKEIYAGWLPDYPEEPNYNIDLRDLLEKTKVPYIPYFSYGEKLPVVEHGTKDPQGIGYAYETITALIAHGLEGVRDLLENRETFIKRARYHENYFKKDITVTPVIKREDSPRSDNRRTIYAGIIITILLLAGWVILKQSDVETADQRGKDSVQHALDFVVFKNKYLSDTANAESLALLCKDYYKLQPAYRDSAWSIKQKMDVVIRQYAEVVVQSFYVDVANQQTQSGAPADYFADSVTRFMNQDSISKNELAALFKQYSRDNYQNTIENASIKNFTSDSAGFTAEYIEAGNFRFDSVGIAPSGVRYRDLVALRLDHQLKFKSFYYKERLPVERPTVTPVKKPIRIDIFLIKENATLYEEDLADDIKVLAKAYEVRVRTMPASLNEKVYLSIQNEIRYNFPDEERQARELATKIKRATGINFQLRPVKQKSLNYISIFIHKARANK